MTSRNRGASADGARTPGAPGARSRRSLPRTVIALGVVSFFTDFSSEMIYPLLPVFLTTTLGAGAVALGVIEGIAESTASLLKVVSGAWTDRTRRRKPFLLAGYGLAGAARPLIGLAAAWPMVLGIRFLDRAGKGLRSAPRDALIADVTAGDRRGAAYGLHRAMDHAGAVAGPLAAAALLTGAGVALRDVFLLAVFPAAVVMLVLLLAVREKRLETEAGGKPLPADPAPAATTGAAASGRPAQETPDGRRPLTETSAGGRLGGWLGWGEFPARLRVLLLAVFVFTLGNSTDAFLLLTMKDAGLSGASIALLWSLHHVVRMVATYFGGRSSDRAGHGTLLLLGWLFYACVYLAFGWVDSRPLLIAIFLAYGIYFGLTEPAEKAWVADLAPARLRGRAFGSYHFVVGLGALPASLLFGLLWTEFGRTAAFTAGAGFALLSAVLLLPATRPPRDGRLAAGGPRPPETG